MKLKTIASIFNRNKYLTIFTTTEGEQWIGNGAAMYSMRGLPTMNPEAVLRIFDVPPDNHEKWLCSESPLPEIIDFDDTIQEESDIEPEKVEIEWLGVKYWLFPDGNHMQAIKEEYIKPLLDELDYLTFHRRRTIDGGFVLAAKIGFELKAVICPFRLHTDEKFIESISRICSHFRAMERDNIIDTADELFGAFEREQASEADNEPLPEQQTL